MFRYPFSPFTGMGLGISYSSLTQIGEILPGHAFGQGGIKAYVNVTTGNLVVIDRIATAQEMSGPVSLGFIYNSQAEHVWRLAHRALKTFNPANPAAQTIVLIEKDGHETIYMLDPVRQEYIAPGCGDGRPYFSYNKTSKEWHWLDPKSGRREIYNAQGLLVRFVDVKGRTATCAYDTQNRLQRITGPHRNKYEIIWDKNTVRIVMIDSSGITKLLQTHLLTSDGRIEQTMIPDANGYVIKYRYENPRNIYSIEQSDGTLFMPDILYNGREWRTTRIIAGHTTGNIFRINYVDTSTTVIEEPGSLKSQTTIVFDAKARVAKFVRQNGDKNLSKITDTTTCKYTQDGQLDTITRPNSGQEIFLYDTLGLCCHHVGAEGQEEHFHYDQVRGCLLSHIQIFNPPDYVPLSQHQSTRQDLLGIDYGVPLPQEYVTRYVYDFNFDRKNASNRVLRFVISPLGKVTEYRYDNWGNRESARIYTDKTYDISKLDSLSVPTLAEMETWVGLQDPGAIQLGEFEYDWRGQLSRHRAYTNVDTQGHGISDSGMAQSVTNYMYFGALGQELVRQTPQATTEYDRRYDDLTRLELEIKAELSDVEQSTGYNYRAGASKVVITRPNGRTEEQDWDTQGAIVQETQTAQAQGNTQTQLTKYECDCMGRTVITDQPDGKKHWTFYDRQDRLVFSLNQVGALTEYVYDKTHGFTGTIQYAIPLNLSKLQPFPEILPTVVRVRDLIVPAPGQDRQSYKFYDKSNRLHYEVDSCGYITEHCCDNLDRKIGTIKYADPITADQLAALQQGKDIQLHYDVNKDRFQQYFYNAENKKIGEQDSAGYVTEYKLDIAGNTTEKIIYAVPTSHFASLDKVRPAPSAEDIHNYYFYDKRGQCIAQIDGENYMARLEYSASGKVIKQTRYAQHVKADPSVTRDLSQLQPDADPEDQVTTYKYDALDREIERDLPNLSTQITEYDTMDHKTMVATVDQTDTKKERRTLYRYNGWEQIEAECDPLVAQVLADIDADPNIPPDQKEAEKEKVWKDSSLRYEYDTSGLRLKSTDPEGNVTYYYYDDARQPRFSVDARGVIKENIYNAFGEVTVRRIYTNFVPQEILAMLKGGFLTAETQALFDGLKDEAKDVKTTISRNKLGQAIQQTDGEGYITKNTYNAFGECVTEEKPLTDKTPSMTVVHTKDVRGLETATTTSSADLSVTVTREYKSALGKCTKKTDEIGGEYTQQYDKRGNVTAAQDPLGAVHSVTHDSFDRPVRETNSLGQITAHQYDTKQRLHRISGQDASGTELIHRTEQSNAFGEVETYTDAIGDTHTVTHGPDGQVTAHKDELGRETNEKYNLCGKRIEHKSADGVVTAFKYDGSGNMNEQVIDPAGLALKSTAHYNASGSKDAITDARGITSTQEYDRRNLPQKTTLDPGGLNITTQTTYNGQGKKSSEVKGDANDPNQRDTRFIQDSLNRDIGKTVDPAGLALTTANHLDAAGHIIASIDGEGNVNRIFYNAAGQKRFVVDAEGRITEWHYNSEGQIMWQRDYANIIDPKQLTDQTTLAELKNLLTGKMSSADSITYKFYDDLGRIRFIVNSLGTVTEKFYDARGLESATTLYANQVKIANLTTTQEVAAALKPDAVHDRTNYQILDAAGKERYAINPLGVITEQRFDAMGRVIASITYANPASDPAALAKLPVDQIDAHINKDPINDRAVYHVFDSKGRPAFDVDAECAVTKYTRDADDNLSETCAFVDKIQIPGNYQDLVALLNSLKPDSQRDRITQSKYNAANKEISKTDAKQNIEQYQYDALNQQRVHTDKAGEAWGSVYDKGGRLVQELTPAVTTTIVNPDLTETVETKPVVKKTDYDKANNQIAVTLGDGTKDASTIDITYNAVNKPTALSVKQVSIKTVYDAKGLEVVKQDESGHCHFLVYDAEKQLRYEVNAKGAVIGYERNAFGEPVLKTYYANLLGIDLSQYAKTGLSISTIEQHLQPSIDDRVQEYEYDRQGNISSVKGNEVYYYVREQDTLKYGLGRPETRYSYNAFNEPIYTGVLIDPEANTWSEKITWVDRNGKPLAQTDPNYYVIRYTRNAFGDEQTRAEYAAPLSAKPNAEMTLAELDSKISPNQDDRHYSSEYDQLGQKTSDTTHNVVVQALTTNPDNTPDFHDLPAQDLTKRYQFSPTGKQTAVTNEDGSTAYTYYDARGNKVAETKVPRASGDGSTLIPLTVYGINAHGQISKTTNYRKGTAHADGTQVPAPIDAADSANQTSRVVFDSRGLKIITQDAEGHVTNYAYTPTGQEARRWYFLTNSDGQHTDEKRTTYDELDKPTKTEYLRDGHVDPVYTQVMGYNAFAQQISRGAAETDQPEYQRYDRAGQEWSHNRNKGCPVIVLYDLAGRQTVSLESATHYLGDVKYTEVQDMLSTWDTDDLERTERGLDLGGKLITSRAPVYKGTDNSKPGNMPLDLSVAAIDSKIMLSWASIVETNLDVSQITLWPVNNKSAKSTLDLVTHDGRTWADVTGLASDIYEFHVDVTMVNPATQQPEIKYTATGKIQIATAHNETSTALVATIKDDLFTLNLTGKTAGLTAIELWQDDKQIATIPITPNQTDIGLSSYASGTYRIRPKYGTAYEDYSFPFTIFTAQPASAPLARELECQAQVLFGQTQGEFIWQVPDIYKDQQLRIEFICTAALDDRQIAYQGAVETKAGQGTCTIDLPNEAITLNHLSVSMLLDGQWVPLLDQDAPTLNLIVDDKTQYQFTNTTTLQISSIPGLNTTDEFVVEYQDRTMDCMQTWKLLPVKANYPGTLIVNADQVFTGKYNYRITNKTTGQEIFHGVLDVRRNTQVYMSDDGTSPGDTRVAPVRSFEYDAWGNRTKQVNTLGEETVTTYNHLNKPLTETTPPVPVVNPDGSTTTRPIVTANGYDVLGTEIANRDGEGHVIAFIVNAAGQTLVEILGEGTHDRSTVYDALARITAYADARGKTWRIEYDRLNHKVCTTSPLERKDLTSYNELGKRRAQAHGQGNMFEYVLRYDYDAAGHIIAEYQPDGTKAAMQYDPNGQLLTKANKDGTISFQRDLWGTEITSTDLSGAQYTNEYDQKRQLTRRSSAGGNHGTYLPFNAFNMQFSTDPQPVPAQDQRYTYRAGLCVQVYDAATGQTTAKDYDTERRPISRIIILADATIVQHITTQYDGIGRIYWTNDTNALVTVGYDGANNRRTVKATVNYDTRTGKDSKTVTQSFQYNNADQVTNDNGTIVSYKDGYRYQADNTTYQFDDDGLLVQTNSPPSTRVYDAAFRVTSFSGDGMQVSNRYNANGYLAYSHQAQNGGTADTTFSEFTADGEAGHQYTNYGDVQDDLTTEFVKFFDLRMHMIHGSRSDRYGTDYATVVKYNDPNGAVQAIAGASDSGKNGYFITDSDGHILMRFRADWTIIREWDRDWFRWRWRWKFVQYCHLSRSLYDIGGNVLMSYNISYVPSMRVNISDPSDLQLYLDYFRPITKDYPPPTPGDYVVMEGDTFTSISQANYGEPNEAGLIADANNWNVSDTPDPGVVLTIPQLIPSTNAYGEAKPYQDFMAIMIGNLYPNLQTPQPHKKHHHWWQRVLEVIVEVVVAVAVAEICAPLFAAMVGANASIVGGMVAGSIAVTGEAVGVAELSAFALTLAVAGALGDAAEQGLAIGFHDQSKFSFKEMGIAGVESTFLPPDVHQSLINVLKYAAMRSVEMQLYEMAMGLRSKFDFRAVVEQTAMAGVDKNLCTWTNSDIGNRQFQQFIQSNYTEHMIQALSGEAIACAVYGTRFNITDAAVQYVGYVAQDEGSQVKRKLYEQSQLAQQRYQASQAAAQGNKGMLDSPYRRNTLNSAAQKAAAAAGGKTAWGYGESFEDSVQDAVLKQWSQNILGDNTFNPLSLQQMDPSGYLSMTAMDAFKYGSDANLTPRQLAMVNAAGTRIGYGLQAVGGVGEMFAGEALTDTGLGAVVGIPMMVHGADVAGTGVNELISGHPQATLTMKAAEAWGASPQTAAYINAIPTLAAGAFGIAAGTAALVGRLGVFGEGTGVTATSIDLYRAVTPAEYTQIKETGVFKNLPGMAEGKYFSTSLKGIQQYSEMAEKAFGDKSYAFVKTTIPKSVVTNVMNVEVDSGIDSIFVPPEHLPLLTEPEFIERELIERSVNNVNP